MKAIDLTSLFVAAMLGGFLLVGWNSLYQPAPLSTTQAATAGIVIGAGVQIGVRLLGVS